MHAVLVLYFDKGSSTDLPTQRLALQTQRSVKLNEPGD
jgi:hypothetical protein